MGKMEQVVELLQQEDVINTDIPGITIYRSSFTNYDGIKMVMVKEDLKKWLVVTGSGQLYDDLNGNTLTNEGKLCPLSHENRLVLNRYFDYTVPKAFGNSVTTIGLGDRLGLASQGHIETIRNKAIKPILAQQSIRELLLTNRSMEDVIDAASYAVFQEGYKGGFGADGDHLKKEEDIKLALSLGMTMLTLDCSDYIQNGLETLGFDQIKEKYQKLPKSDKAYYKEEYLNKTFDANGIDIYFDEKELMKNVLIYKEAISYMVYIYEKYISKQKSDIDFEISIDETETITSPQQHFFVANELKLQNIKVTSLAPRFCGEFQKGIDYIGDIPQFEKELEMHALIARYFNYKLSIHSGSDKFKVFPIINQYTNGLFHLKTAGTNWLEAVRVIAKVNPNLYRRMHRYALEHFEEAQSYYHVTPNLSDIKDINDVGDNELSDYMNKDASRQLFHITYGLLLTMKDESGNYGFKEEFFKTLKEHEVDYRDALISHIGKHISTLGF